MFFISCQPKLELLQNVQLKSNNSVRSSARDLVWCSYTVKGSDNIKFVKTMTPAVCKIVTLNCLHQFHGLNGKGSSKADTKYQSD